jgi:hypothetical protein
MQPADLIWVDYFNDHPAVVIEVYADGRLLIVCGTGTDRAWDTTKIRVDYREPAGKKWGLGKQTYFYASKVAIVNTAAVTRRMGQRCPPSLFHKFEALVRSATASVPEPVAAPALVAASVPIAAPEPASVAEPEPIAAYAPEPVEPSESGGMQLSSTAMLATALIK